MRLPFYVTFYLLVLRRYDSVYNRAPAQSAGRGDGIVGGGQRVNHITLNNVNMDHVHPGSFPS